MAIEWFCRICGLEQEEPAWENGLPSYNPCECCGAEFGYQDCKLTAIKKHRQRWIESGYVWSSPEYMPSTWDPKKQMENIPEEFR